MQSDKVLSGNDPGWGRQEGDGPTPLPTQGSRNKPSSNGPPDLEALWNDLQVRLSRLFGGKGGPRPPHEPRSMPRPRSWGSVLLVIVLLWLGSGFFIIQEGQVGVISQFGRYHHTTGPGIQWRLPYPIQNKETVNVSQIRTIEVGYRDNMRTKVANESLMLTDDENIIDMQFAVQYRIKNAAEYLFNNRNAEDTVMQAAETSIREVVGRNKMDFVLYEGREQVGLQVAQLMQHTLDRYKVGIIVSNVTVQNAQPPAQVQAAFDDAVKAGQDRERLKNEGQAYANDVIPKAKGSAARLLEEAQGYKQRILAQAEGDASRFKAVLSEYAKAPAVTRERLYLETMQQVYSNVSKVLNESRQGSSMLYLPLDKLINQSRGNDTGAVAAPQAAGGGSLSAGEVNGGADGLAGAATSRYDTGESRSEGFRNREREVR
jgi:membrane protease subunit HflK